MIDSLFRGELLRYSAAPWRFSVFARRIAAVVASTAAQLMHQGSIEISVLKPE
jgi:hypothetical protein